MWVIIRTHDKGDITVYGPLTRETGITRLESIGRRLPAKKLPQQRYEKYRDKTEPFTYTLVPITPLRRG